MNGTYAKSRFRSAVSKKSQKQSSSEEELRKSFTAGIIQRIAYRIASFCNEMHAFNCWCRL